MRVLNKKYWPYQFDLPKEVVYVTDVDKREAWCEENLKASQWRSFGWNIKTFAFKNAEDATVFKLMFK
jgi:hypothetical protein